MDMTRFETAPRFSRWAGVAPGNDESAGKQRSGKTRKGNRPLRAILTQLAMLPYGPRTTISPLPYTSASPYAVERSGPSLPWRTPSCAVSFNALL